MLSWAWPMVPWPGGVEQDFLEVPSMALEKFACEPVLLQRVAKHFSGQGPKLEDKVTIGGNFRNVFMRVHIFYVNLCHKFFFFLGGFDWRTNEAFVDLFPQLELNIKSR